MQNILYAFKQDLGQLYCLTKNSKIESVFLKLSQSIDENFNKWFSRNRTNIRSKLQSPEVADLLDALMETRKTYYSVSIVDFVDMINGGNKKISGGIGRNVGNIKGLKGFLSDADLQSILSPYQDIIEAAQNFSEQPTIPVSTIASDLKTIKSYYLTYLSEISLNKDENPTLKNPSLKKRQKQFFAYVLQRFTKEVSNAAERGGLKDFADQIRSDGLLAKPDALDKYGVAISVDMFAMDRANNIIKAAMKNVNEDQFPIMYEYIKEQTMEFTDLISTSDLADLYRERERKEDISEYLGTEAKPTELVTIGTNDQMWLNPSFLGMLSYILNQMHRIVKN